MFERVQKLNVVYVPNSVDPDAGVRLGSAWLREQSGQPMVLLAAKKSYSNNRLLPQLTAGATVASGRDVWKSQWRGGPILAPWPSEEVLAALSDDLAELASSVCVIEWGEKAFVSAWLDAHGAVDLTTGGSRSRSSDALLSPVVQAAMEDLSRAVNHNNALVQGYEKSYAVRTLQVLHRAGYSIDVDALCAWALANGFTQAEVKHLRSYALQVLDGRGFRLPERVGPTAASIRGWEMASRADDATA